MSDQQPDPTDTTLDPTPDPAADPAESTAAPQSETAPAVAADQVVVMQDPGSSMTSTGESIVENDLGDLDFEAALEGTLRPMDEGMIIEGVVVKIDPDEVLLDIGYKSEGVVPVRELSIKMDVDPNEVVQIGDVVEALILQKEDDEGRVVLSKKRAQYERAWGTIERIYTDDGTVVGTVIEVVKGGLILDIGLRGFLPASLVEMRRVRDLAPYVGQQLECKIIELDKNRNNVVLSRRKFLEETQSEFRQEFLQTLQKGEIRKGVVSSIVNFGAFVDLGGVDGLVHVSELSWHHIDHPSEVVEVGDEVAVEVLDVDLDRERVSLSLKSTQEDPWQKFARENAVGDIVDGEVTKLVPFGAFVKVEEGIEGLVHISELAERHVEVPEAVVNVGDQVEIKVIDIDTVRRRISLSLKQAGAPSGDAAPSASPYEEEPTAAPAYTSGDDDDAPSGSSMAGALAAAGLVKDSGPSPEEMALAEAELPEERIAAMEADDTVEAAEASPAADAEGAAPEAGSDEAPVGGEQDAVEAADATADAEDDTSAAAEDADATADADAEEEGTADQDDTSDEVEADEADDAESEDSPSSPSSPSSDESVDSEDSSEEE